MRLKTGRLRVKLNPKTDCWEWQGARAGGSKKQEGYATVSVDAKNIDVHRMMYAVFNGAIPWRHCVMHTCDNRSCINPAHLTVGTLSENAKDMWRKERGIRGEKNGLSKLNKYQVLEIRKLYAKGDTSYSKLGKLYGVCPQAVWMIVKRKNWKHI